MREVSICIPVYDFSVERLLHCLARDPSIDRAEIILIDDASPLPVRERNASLAREKGVAYHQLKENVGRSRIRNLFTRYANTSKLIFLDCDVLPSNEDFLSDYLASAVSGDTVLCGKINYPPTVSSTAALHWTFGRKRESIPATIRNRRPYNYFMTGNCLIPKAILEKIPFDSGLTGYGYEDLLFAIELEKANIPLKHLDIGAEHLRLDSAPAFMQKTESAVRNLCNLYDRDELRPALQKRVRLASVYESMRRKGLAGALNRPALAQRLRKQLERGSTALRLLDLYKLILFTSLRRQVRQD